MTLSTETRWHQGTRRQHSPQGFGAPTPTSSLGSAEPPPASTLPEPASRTLTILQLTTPVFYLQTKPNHVTGTDCTLQRYACCSPEGVGRWPTAEHEAQPLLCKRGAWPHVEKAFGDGAVSTELSRTAKKQKLLRVQPV